MVRITRYSWFFATFLVLTLVGGLSLSAQAANNAAPQGKYAERAIASYQAIQKYFAVSDGSHLYLEWYPKGGGDNPYSYLWPFSQTEAATIDLANLPNVGGTYVTDVQSSAQALEHYWNPSSTTGLPGYASYVRPPYGNGGDLFYDDNAWVGLSAVQWYGMSKDASALVRAKQIFDLAVSGWDTDPSHPAPGGVFWTQAPWSHDRNTVSNMPNAELGLRLYQITGNSYYLDWAKKMYDWTNTNLLAPNGLYWDHIDLAGNIEKTQWSYNQGVPIGVNVLFYQITKDHTYLQRAQTLAKTALNYYINGGRLFSQPPYFNAIFFKNLLLLQSVDNNKEYERAMQDYADTVWNLFRDPATGLFHFSKADQTYLLEQASMTQIYAVLAWDKDDYQNLY